MYILTVYISFYFMFFQAVGGALTFMLQAVLPNTLFDKRDLWCPPVCGAVLKCELFCCSTWSSSSFRPSEPSTASWSLWAGNSEDWSRMTGTRTACCNAWGHSDSALTCFYCETVQSGRESWVLLVWFVWSCPPSLQSHKTTFRQLSTKRLSDQSPDCLPGYLSDYSPICLTEHRLQRRSWQLEVSDV